jgi:hypothetical protein
MWAALLKHFIVKRRTSISHALSSRVAFTRDLLLGFSSCDEKQIPRKSDSG